jgi:hypothetical protein
MADIVDPRAISYTNQVIRPLAEQMRSLKARVDSGLVTWFADIDALVPNDASPLLDGREAEGVSRLTGADITGLVTQLAAYQTALNVNGVAAVISKPCVRALEVNG